MADGAWVYQLNAEHLGELHAAMEAVQRDGRVLEEITRADAKLPTLAPELARIRDEVHHGRGVVLLRGLDVQTFSVEDAAILFWLITVDLGEIVSQSDEGERLVHVFDRGLDLPLTRVRGFVTRLHLPFHNDASDVVGLLCVQPAMQGGWSSVASTATAHDVMFRTEPDLLAEMYQPFHFHRRGSQAPGEPPTRQQPIFRDRNGQFYCRYVPFLIRTAPEALGHPLPERQTAALDLFDAVLDSPDVRLHMDFQPGDIQILNNNFIVHSRTEFVDWPDAARKRHLLRLWLSFSN